MEALSALLRFPDWPFFTSHISQQEEYSYSVLLKGESDVAKITKVSFP